jgi:Leucine-rich repeat (LRR) protein
MKRNGVGLLVSICSLGGLGVLSISSQSLRTSQSGSSCFLFRFSYVSLTQLWLQENQIVDVSPLATLTSLTELWLQENQIVDVSPLSTLTSLTRLVLHLNQIVDVSPLLLNESGGRASSAGGGGLGGAAGMLTMRRLQAPARHEPDIDQHQRRALWPSMRETSSYVQKRAVTQPLRGRFGAVPVI